MKRFFILCLTMALALSAWGDDVVTANKTWTFETMSTGELAQATSIDGLVIKTGSTTVAEETLTISDLGGESLNITKYIATAASSLDASNSAWSKRRNAASTPKTFNNTLAFDNGRPGICYVYLKGTAKDESRSHHVLFQNGSTNAVTESTITTTEAHNAEKIISHEAITSGTFFIITGKAANVYAVKYVPEAVTAPSISNNNGTITITAGASNLSGDGNATIKTYYTTDGTDPTGSSTEYTGSFDVATSCTVKAISINTTTGTTSSVSSENVTIAAATHTVTIGSHNHGILALSCVSEGENTGTCAVGETVTITTGPDPGYTTGTVKAYKTDDDKTKVTVADKTSFTMPDYDVTVSVTYNRADLSVTPNVVGNGSLSFVSSNNDNTKFQIGNTVTITVTPNEGYRLKEGTLAATYNDGGSTQSIDIVDNTFTMPGYDVTVSAEFESNTQTATITAEAEQSVIYNGAAQAAVATASAGGVVITYYTNAGHTEGETTTAPTNAGTYYAIVSQSDAGYSSDPVNVTFTINKATLTAAADNKSKTVGEANPELTVTVTGFVNNETAETAAGYTAPTATTDATNESQAGEYTITVSGGSADNYSFRHADGILTVTAALEAVPVFLTAGQSNTAGRCMNDNLPDYIKALGANNNGAYQYCNWSYTNGSTRRSESEGVFRKFWPEMESAGNSGRFAYDAIVYYWAEKALQRDFYVVKHAAGGTSVDPSCTSTNDYHWSADATWLAGHASCNTEGGTSMLKAFCDNIGKSIDAITAAGKTPDIKAMIWHQGESDRSGTGPDGYHDNLKAVMKYVRDYLVAKTGDNKYATLDIICGTVPANSKQYNKKVYDALFTLASEDSHFHVIETSPGTFIGDDLHFDTNCAERLGIGMYNKMVDLGLVNGEKQTVPEAIIPEGQPIRLDFKTWAADNLGDKSVQKPLTLSTEGIKTLDGDADVYKAIGCEGDGDFSEFAETFALSANEVKMRGSVGLQLNSNKVVTLSLLNLALGDGVTITFGAGSSGVTTLATLSENVFVSDDATQTVLTKGTALTSKSVTYVVKSGNQIDLTFGSTGGHYINAIDIQPQAVEILPDATLPAKPTVTLADDSRKDRKVYAIEFGENQKLYFKRPGVDDDFKSQSYKADFAETPFKVTIVNNGELECYTTETASGQTLTSETVAINVNTIAAKPSAAFSSVDGQQSVYTLTFSKGNTLHYTLGDAAEQTLTSEDGTAEIRVPTTGMLEAWGTIGDTESDHLNTRLYAPTPAIEEDGVYDFSKLKEAIGADYVIGNTGWGDAVTTGDLTLYKPDGVMAATLDRFAFAPRLKDDGSKATDWRLLNAGRLRATKSATADTLAILGLKQGERLTITYSGAAMQYMTESTAKLADGTTTIESKAAYEILSDGDLLLVIPADETNHCDITQLTTSSEEIITAPTVTLKNGAKNQVTVRPGSSSFGKTVTTYYTTDGTEPTQESESIAKATNVTLTGTSVVKVVSISETGASSATARAVLTIQEGEGENGHVDELIRIEDDSHATVSDIYIGESANSVTISGTADGVPVTALATNLLTAENTAGVAAIDLSATAISLSGERSELDALKAIGQETLLYLPESASVTGTNVVVKQGSDYSCDDYLIQDGSSCVVPQSFTATEARLNRSFTANRKCTVCLPFNFKAQGGTFYKFTGISEGKVQMTAEEDGATLTANTPYIFMPSSDATGVSASQVEVAAGERPQTENATSQFTFFGTYEKIQWDNPSGIYGFAAEDKGNTTAGQFVRVGSGAYIEGCRAYLQYTGDGVLSDAGTRSIDDLPDRLEIVWVPASTTGHGGTTAINGVTADQKEHTPVYNLNGQQVSGSYKGLVIRNGKKVVIR